MTKDNDKLQLYISREWLKAFLKLIVTVIIPYDIVMFLLWKYTKLLSPSVGCTLSIWGSFAISFVWAFIRKHRVANKEE